MGFVVLFAASWAVVFILATMKKSLSVLENAFVYLIILAIGIHVSWITAEEFKFVKLTTDGLRYAGYLMYRTVAMPLIYVILMNAAVQARALSRILVSAAVALIAILGLNGLMLYYRVWQYPKWNLGYDAIEVVALEAIVYGLLKLYRRSALRGAKA